MLAVAALNLYGPIAPILYLALEKWSDAPEPTPQDEARIARSVALSKRCGGDSRGNNRNRRIRKLALLKEFGDGVTCRCAYCGAELSFYTLTQDRIHRARGYVPSNLLPACFACNRRRSNHPPFKRKWVDQEDYDLQRVEFEAACSAR